MLMIRSLHDALDLQFIHDDIRISFGVGIAGMKNVLFVLQIKAELFQIILSVKKRDHEISLVCQFSILPRAPMGGCVIAIPGCSS